MLSIPTYFEDRFGHHWARSSTSDLPMPPARRARDDRNYNAAEIGSSPRRRSVRETYSCSIGSQKRAPTSSGLFVFDQVGIIDRPVRSEERRVGKECRS